MRKAGGQFGEGLLTAGHILKADSGGIPGTPVLGLSGTACDKSCCSGLANTKGSLARASGDFFRGVHGDNHTPDGGCQCPHRISLTAKPRSTSRHPPAKVELWYHSHVFRHVSMPASSQPLVALPRQFCKFRVLQRLVEAAIRNSTCAAPSFLSQRILPLVLVLSKPVVPCLRKISRRPINPDQGCTSTAWRSSRNAPFFEGRAPPLPRAPRASAN